ncbi:hypothetical protein LX36DRAFT_489177 [Colletotrichum falcatum]|nr:hypothetical protein LX36DRAFT_489177 [Colletotrichum falcatum]
MYLTSFHQPRLLASTCLSLSHPSLSVSPISLPPSRSTLFFSGRGSFQSILPSPSCLGLPKRLSFVLVLVFDKILAENHRPHQRHNEAERQPEPRCPRPSQPHRIASHPTQHTRKNRGTTDVPPTYLPFWHLILISSIGTLDLRQPWPTTPF